MNEDDEEEDAVDDDADNDNDDNAPGTPKHTRPKNHTSVQFSIRVSYINTERHHNADLNTNQ